MSTEEDWRGKFERSEAARQKLREALVLLKEKGLNTEQLLKQHDELKEELATAKKAKHKAESAASKLKKDKEEMRKRVGRLEDQLSQVQSQMAVILNQQHPGTLTASGSAMPDVVTRTEMNAIKTQVAGLEKQLSMWNKAMKEVKHQTSGGGGGLISKKRPAAAVEEDPARARAVAMLQANKSPTGKEQQQQQQRQLPSKKRVRLDEGQQQEQQQQQQLIVLGGGSAGGSEAAPPGFADVAIAALRAVMGADAEQPPSSAAVQDALRILGPLKTISLHREAISNISSQKRNIIAAFACAVLECAAAAPARRFAAASLSPQHWFTEIPTVAVNGKKAQQSSASRNKKNAAMKTQDLTLPSFLGVWCSTEVLQRHSLPWLLHCTVELSHAGAAATAAATATASDTNAEENLSQLLAKDLALLVMKDVATSSPRPLLHSPTELCAAAAAAAALWRSQGDVRSFQVFLLDILLSKLWKNEEDVMAPLAAAIESWPEALPPSKGTLGKGLHGVLQYAACLGGQRSRLLEIRLAATWLRKIGVQEWGWREGLSDEDLEAIGAEARKQLAKFGMSTLAVAVKPVP